MTIPPIKQSPVNPHELAADIAERNEREASFADRVISALFASRGWDFFDRVAYVFCCAFNFKESATQLHDEVIVKLKKVAVASVKQAAVAATPPSAPPEPKIDIDSLNESIRAFDEKEQANKEVPSQPPGGPKIDIASLNDSIAEFDRLQEWRKRHKRKPA